METPHPPTPNKRAGEKVLGVEMRRDEAAGCGFLAERRDHGGITAPLSPCSPSLVYTCARSTSPTVASASRNAPLFSTPVPPSSTRGPPGPAAAFRAATAAASW